MFLEHLNKVMKIVNSDELGRLDKSLALHSSRDTQLEIPVISYRDLY